MALLEAFSRKFDLDNVMPSLRLSSRKDGPCDRTAIHAQRYREFALVTNIFCR